MPKFTITFTCNETDSETVQRAASYGMEQAMDRIGLFPYPHGNIDVRLTKGDEEIALYNIEEWDGA